MDSLKPYARLLTLSALVACGDGEDSAGVQPQDAGFVVDAPVTLDSAPVDAAPVADAPPAVDTGPDAPVAFVPPDFCVGEQEPPMRLACTGLYQDMASKRVAPGVREYAPAYALWSDGSDKQRWVRLPPGTTIDNTDPQEWVFPIGTKFFKEFSRDGRRVETRMWQKLGVNFWVPAAYQWNDTETEAHRTAGGDIRIGEPDAGVTYHIPLTEECEKCHRGRNEHILGFGTVELGLKGATGVTLRMLKDEGLLTNPPENTQLEIGDDGSGLAAPVLGWLHANCGITCHNTNPRAHAYITKMDLRLDPALLDGRPVGEVASYSTTVSTPATTAKWMGRERVVPGNPNRSLLYMLISTRGQGDQMPPFASDVIDPVNTVLVAEWIRRLPPPPPPDGGVMDAAADAGNRDSGRP